MAEEQKHLQDLSDDYQKLQGELQFNVEARQKLEAQQQENQGVQKEFAKLAEDANIYKLVGPVLLKQEKSEAILAVNGRLDYIEKEIKRVEKLIGDIQEKSQSKKMEVYRLQTQMQQAQQQVQAAS
ncbi:MAG: prefoldin subunit 6 [Lasallia pustulata]|uniref:Prefoldin subunit 6 n=1 Tax=Lasallia pustulata TaxID=136370 RepID=A0A1W5D1Z2_9LECA|nr:MAG: prefoldin subunit 6 [Lasallia pustulata]SLM37168.1 prefoldin subunit 6 [Lasallia pustulata]